MQIKTCIWRGSNCSTIVHSTYRPVGFFRDRWYLRFEKKFRVVLLPVPGYFLNLVPETFTTYRPSLRCLQ